MIEYLFPKIIKSIGIILVFVCIMAAIHADDDTIQRIAKTIFIYGGIVFVVICLFGVWFL